MKVIFHHPVAQQHPLLGVLKPGENELPEGPALDEALKVGLVKAAGRKPARKEEE